MTNALVITLGLLVGSPNSPEIEALRWSLGEVESGNKDHVVGQNREVSRFQITPENWKRLTKWPIEDAKKEMLAWDVVRRFLEYEFSCWHNRNEIKLPVTCIYALWSRPGKFRAAHYRLSALTRREQDRCRRFANLYEMKLKELKRANLPHSMKGKK
jgi:hypothetical protein